MKKLILLVFGALAVNVYVYGQVLTQRHSFTRADTLRGMLSPLRSCYDINYYHLDIKVDIGRRFISGSNLFQFTANSDFSRLQFDLFKNLLVEKVVYKGKELKFTREYDAVFVDFEETIKQGSKEQFTVYYSGRPVVAKNPPWDGGFIFTHDSAKKPWVAVTCQGLGASSWWPNKDHQSDEVDSMLISIAVPEGLTNVSNGRLRSSERLTDGYTRFNWFVSYPINNYNVTLNIADFAHFSDVYSGEKGSLDLDYYVLKENLQKAKPHFDADVKRMLSCFEHWFGPYPFYHDGYKLVEAPYLGMEHQSAVAYGNQYKKGYSGKDLSGTGLGLSWDYLIIHETGHEWFGNNITSKDIADMWIHEAFTTYSEGLFVECNEGKQKGAEYIKGERKAVLNDTPVIGTYNVNKEGSGDMYFKGTNMLHTIRSIVNDDETWRKTLRGLNSTFGLKTVTSDEIIAYVNQSTGKDLNKVFEQYLNYTSIPTLEIKKGKGGKASLNYRWKSEVKGFNMPLKVRFLPSNDGDWFFIQPSADWKSLTLPEGKKSLEADTDNFFIETSQK